MSGKLPSLRVVTTEVSKPVYPHLFSLNRGHLYQLLQDETLPVTVTSLLI